ncbi:hypothetical protein ACFYS8_00800 [Kitasatospora sp. NPDC004615]|uniref:hypothetical protein n=1 Tax=Kitasatospora sp. NPDC004615 TaxID=3364017 RepID=UPI0036819B4A
MTERGEDYGTGGAVAAGVDAEGEAFGSLTRTGWRAYVRSTYKSYGSKSYREVCEQAKALDPASTLGTSTVGDVLGERNLLKGKKESWPSALTATRIGLGIGGPELGATFRKAWDSAEANHKRWSHQYGLRSAQEAQQRERWEQQKHEQKLRRKHWQDHRKHKQGRAQEERRRVREAHGKRFWFPGAGWISGRSFAIRIVPALVAIVLLIIQYFFR